MEASSPAARMASFRITAAISAEFDLVLYGGDINTAYLNATPEIAQYVDGIEGYPCEDPSYVYVVRKALYGLRQSGREWNSEINGGFLIRGFERCATESCLYYLIDGEKIVLLLIYVDDVICATNDEECKIGLFAELDKAYCLKDHGRLTEFLGIEVTQTEKGVFISQEKYAKNVLFKLGFGEANKCGNPMESTTRLPPATKDDNFDSSFDYRGALGMLMYLATGNRPNLAFALGQLCRFVVDPTLKHVATLKRVLRYLVGTQAHSIMYKKGSGARTELTLSGFRDSDWGSDPETRKSTSGFALCWRVERRHGCPSVSRL
ncbi:putative reverse transcriptase, RNA-dependent DNA polymerase [Plasmopara halstedii]